MTKLNAAVIGCGSWGRNHARVYSELPNVNLVAVADTAPAAANEVAEKYRVKPYTESAKLLEDPDIQLVSICTPTVTHARLALQAIEQGKHVLVEKPMTNTVKEAKTLIKASKKRGVTLTVGFVERFNPAVQEAHRRIAKGEIGGVILAHTRRVSQRPLRIGDVGVIKDLAIHDIDITSILFNEEPRTIYATAGSIAHQFEDYANINIGYPENRTAFIEANWLTPKKVRQLNVTGTKGIMTVDYITQQLTIENDQRLTQPNIPYQEPLYLELKSFADSIINDTPPSITGEDGLRTLQICEAALKSSRTGKQVRLP
ncbi:Gfo/Idh/MocA family oxidoreductase [Candidatus Bathyarchaeota archaeon]|jgi:UDP-N-acetylglucosamine 3-dehydrogenase|nr:Gfo/Idh/MocA family oxidoreductase [Candidatus Bathyarchaeota archaeon]